MVSTVIQLRIIFSHPTLNPKCHPEHPQAWLLTHGYQSTVSEQLSIKAIICIRMLIVSFYHRYSILLCKIHVSSAKVKTVNLHSKDSTTVAIECNSVVPYCCLRPVQPGCSSNVAATSAGTLFLQMLPLPLYDAALMCY